MVCSPFIYTATQIFKQNQPHLNINSIDSLIGSNLFVIWKTKVGDTGNQNKYFSFLSPYLSHNTIFCSHRFSFNS